MRSMVELLNHSPVEHGPFSAPRYPINAQMAAQGFTAVNGLDHRESTPEAKSSHPIMSHARTDSTAVSATPAREDVRTSRYSSTRNDSVQCPEPAIKQSPETAKRKRLVTDTIEHPYRDTSTLAGALSPKRRMTETTDEYHSGTLEGTAMSLLTSIEPINRERCSRERSPVPTRNQRTAPPQVRPETQAHLAESLATHLQGAYQDTPENDDQQAQTTTRYNKSPSEAYSPEDPGETSGKRKRNFSNRTKTGCHKCRSRKKKCDETKPTCNNCDRGGFHCTGYGPKPNDHEGPNSSIRAHVPLQSKGQNLSQQQSPAPHRMDGPRYDHWGQVPPAPTMQDHQYRFPPTQSSHEHRHSNSRDIFRNLSWQHREFDGSFPPNILPPPVEYNQTIPPIANLDSRPSHESWRYPSHPSMYGPAATMSPRESVGTHSSHNPPFSYFGSSETSEKYKMLIGEPYRAYIDEELIDDRRSCKAAVERWNEAHSHSRATSDEEKGRLFKCILDPSKRPEPNYQNRPGTIGARVIIDNPFTCDYGYNIHISDDVYIGANCTIEDPCDIFIGARVQIGKNVHFGGHVTSDDPASRKGTQSTSTGGAIIIEEDVNIGFGTSILAHRVIGKGASIGAGSVVTKNIPPYTVAAGNPCRVIRSLPRPADSPERLMKRHSRELTAFTTISSVGSSSGGGGGGGGGNGGGCEDDFMADKQLALENELSLREMRARRGIIDQGK